MILNEWINNNQATWNLIESNKLQTYLQSKFGNHDLLLSNDGAANYLKSQIQVHSNYIKKINYLESEYQKVWDRQTQLVVKTTSNGSNTGTNSSTTTGKTTDTSQKQNNTTNTEVQNNMGYNCDTPFYKETTTIAGTDNETANGTSNTTVQGNTNDTSENTEVLDDILKSLKMLEDWSMFFMQKCDRMVSGMVNLMRGVS